MEVRVRLFAGLAALVGSREVELKLLDGATTDDLKAHFAIDFPAVKPFLSSVVCAVGEEYVAGDHVLRAGDDVALIPPVSGGAAGDRDPSVANREEDV
jgi:molybdopterin synthase catalytic subunit